MKPNNNFDIEGFRSLVAEGTDKLVEAGKMLADYQAKNPEMDVVRHVVEVTRMNFIFVRNLMSLARGEMLREVWGIRCLEKLPVEEQRRVVMGDVKLLCEDGSVVNVDLLHATPAVRRFVVSPTGIRSIDDQRLWRKTLALQAAVKAEEAAASAWRVIGKKLHVLSPYVFTRGQLVKILAGMDEPAPVRA